MKVVKIFLSDEFKMHFFLHWFVFALVDGFKRTTLDNEMRILLFRQKWKFLDDLIEICFLLISKTLWLSIFANWWTWKIFCWYEAWYVTLRYLLFNYFTNKKYSIISPNKSNRNLKLISMIVTSLPIRCFYILK